MDSTVGTSFGVLGPLTVAVDGTAVQVSPQQRAVLAVLLLEAGQVVPKTRLATALWGESQPWSAQNGLQVQVSRLRSRLADVPGVSIETSRRGYLLAVDPQLVDLHRFRRIVAQARASDDATAARLLRSALELWRGPALADVPGEWFATQGAVLDDERVGAVEDRLAADLRLGERGLVDELTALVAQYPLRERLAGHLMLALHAAGRSAEATQVFRRTGETLLEELGIDPGPQLRDLHERIVRGDRDLLPEDGAVFTHPWNLPAGTPTFTGRDPEQARLTEALTSRPDGAATVCVVDGPAGIGKSALAVRVAHQVADQFPDGCLYADLHGTGPHPLEPTVVLGRFLRALGARPGQVPVDVDEAAAQYRTMTADRRVLVVLDDADGAAQVRPFVPAGAGTAVVVTSRRVLASLDAAARVHLEPLPTDEAVTLLGQFVGMGTAAAEPKAARQIAERCGGFPLALRIAGARIAARRGWSLGSFGRRLADEHDRLDELSVDDLAVRSSFQLSYRGLDDGPASGTDAARVFRMVGLLDAPDLGAGACAALTGGTRRGAETALERLVDTHLLERAPRAGRYRMHDLLRVFAREQAQRQETPRGWEAALVRLGDWYASTLERAGRALYLVPVPRLTPDPDRWTATEALSWMDTEQVAALALARQAVDGPRELGEAALRFTAPLSRYLERWGYRQHQRELAELALRTARRLGEPRHESDALNLVGVLHIRLGEADAAAEHFGASLRIRTEIGDLDGQASSLNNLALVHRQRREYARAEELLERCLQIRREMENLHKQASALDNLGLVRADLGDHAGALEYHRTSLTLSRRLGDTHLHGLTLLNLGHALCLAGKPDEAVDAFTRSLGICREFAHDLGEATALRELGGAYDLLGNRRRARGYRRQALEIFDGLGAAEADEVRAELGIGTPSRLSG